MSNARPSTIPSGLHVRCARRRIRPGMAAEVDRWMEMLNARRDEAVATLERERVAAELVFREGDALVWVMVQGEGGAAIDDSPFEIDREHAAFADRCLLPREPEAEPLLLLLPAPVRDAVVAWALPRA
jgi:hypothetical protein